MQRMHLFKYMQTKLYIVNIVMATKATGRLKKKSRKRQSRRIKFRAATRIASARKMKENAATLSSFVAAIWAIAPLFLAAAPLIIFGSARTFVIREKSLRRPSYSTFIPRRTSTRSEVAATTCHVPFGENDLPLALAQRGRAATLTFIKSEFFIKNVASARPNQHRPESGRNYARC